MNSENNLNCFKVYDIRGKLGDELNEGIAYRIGQAAVRTLNAKKAVIGFDARESSPYLANALSVGMRDAGADVLEIGLVGTEEIYAATSTFNLDVGIEVTASHNPIEYNGMKIVKHKSQPLSQKEFTNIRQLAEKNNFPISHSTGSTIDKRGDARGHYIEKILEFVDIKKLKPLKILINSGNGVAGPTINALNDKLTEKKIKTNFVYLQHEPDSSFPNGIPNPLLKENRSTTANAVLEEKADFGVAFDGDYDRCFLFDHFGNFIPGEYVVGLLAEIFLLRERGATIVHDPRVVWNILDVVSKNSGNAAVSKTGHAFVKAKMRSKSAVYGGEISAHHYFRDFYNCDSGMIPWMLIWELLSKKNLSLNDLVANRKKIFLSSGEINFIVANASECIQMIKKKYSSEACGLSNLDGLSMSFNKWRFNLRKSNTEPLVRLNIETNGDEPFLQSKVEELTKLISNV